jgi:long-subunit fatty acid transport protein
MKALILALALVGFTTAGHAEETMGEKAEVKAHDAKRAMKKGAHHAEEATCMKDDTKCLAEKAKHRTSEAGDAMHDKGTEMKNKLDTDKK